MLGSVIRGVGDRSLEDGLEGMWGNVVEGVDGVHVDSLEIGWLDLVVCTVGGAEKTHERNRVGLTRESE